MRREGARRQKNDRKTVLYAYPLHRGSFLQDTLHQQVLVTNKDRLLQRTYFFRSLLGLTLRGISARSPREIDSAASKNPLSTMAISHFPFSVSRKPTYCSSSSSDTS